MEDSRPARDGGLPQDGDAGALPGDGALSDGDAAATGCPPWRPAAAVGRAWLYARAQGSNGVPLTPGVNHVDIYVRRAGDPLPGERADIDDPCAVASYDQTAPKVHILAAAIGFSSQEREFSPQACLEATPCSLELPQSLQALYYVTTANRVSLRPVSDLSESERTKFAADVGKDALARSKALNRPLADELDQAEKATNVPAVDLAIHYSESKLKKKCDARCLDDTSLDPAVRKYLKAARPPRHSNPFDLRTPTNRWQPR